MMDEPSGGRTGGVYIPPFKLAMMKKQQDASNPASQENQKLSWEALRKSINGLINKINVSNIKHIVPELFQENLIRGRGLFARAVMKAQLASPGFTHIYASLVAVINTKLPENGELILKRVIYGFKRAYKRRDKITATALARFIAHLVNHQVSHEILALQLLTVLLEEPTDDSVEIAVGFVKEVGQILDELSPQGLHFVFERFRGILHEGDIDKRVQYTIEGLFAVRKSGFKDYPAIPKELDLVEREDQITFEIGLDDDIDKEEMLDIFRVDPNFAENEKLWEEIKKEILGDDEEEGEYEEEGEAEEQGGEEGAGEGAGNGALVPAGGAVLDLTETELINLRRSIYLTIMSSVSFEECCHKLVKLNIPDGYESELANMLVECCSNERSYIRYYGLMGQRFCMMHRKYQDAFDQVFLTQYSTIHRLETNKLRNVAKFMGHLLCTDALPWTCLEYIKLNEYDTTSSSRIFIKILTQELAEMLGLAMLKERFSDPYMQDVFSGLFPTDTARNTRFAINFFTSVGLGGLTDGLREHLKNAPKLLAQQMQEQMLREQEMKALQNGQEDSSSSDSSSSSSSSSSDSDSDSSSSNSSSSSSSSGSSSSSSSGSSSSTSGGGPVRKSSATSGKAATLNAKMKARSASRSPPRFAGRGGAEPARGRSPSRSPPRGSGTRGRSPPQATSPPRRRGDNEPRDRPPSPERAAASRSPPRRGPPRGQRPPAGRARSLSPTRRSAAGAAERGRASPPRRPVAERSQSASPPRRAQASGEKRRAPSPSPFPPRKASAPPTRNAAPARASPPRGSGRRGRSPSRSKSPSPARRAAADSSSDDDAPRKPRQRSLSSSASPPPRRRSLSKSSGDEDRRAPARDRGEGRRDAGGRRDQSRSPVRRQQERPQGGRDSRARATDRGPDNAPGYGRRGGSPERGGRRRFDSRDRGRADRSPVRRRQDSPRRGGGGRDADRDRGRDSRARGDGNKRPAERSPDRRASRRSPSRSSAEGEERFKRRRRSSS